MTDIFKSAELDECEHPFTEADLRGELNAPVGGDEPMLPIWGNCIGPVVKRRGYFLEVGGARARVLAEAADV